jgi:cell division protein FtsW (lipid II flippase)
LRKWPFLLLFFVLLFPTTIDETKATVVFLPLGLMMTIIAASPPGKRLKILAGGTFLLASFAAILIPIYAAMNAHGITKERQEGLLEFFSDPKQVTTYLNDKKDIGLGGHRLVGRGTAIKFPLQYLARDPVHLAFGLGIGNASHSALGEAYTGEYYELFQYFVVSAAAAFLLEIGVMGTALVLLLYWFVYSDALAVMKSDSDPLTGAIAAGWIGVVCVMGLATFYNVTHAQVAFSYPYWYLSGLIAARRGQLMVLANQTRAASLRRAVA